MTAPSSREVDSWLERIDDITAAVSEVLAEDPLEEIYRREAREKLQREEEALEAERKLLKLKMRYEPKNFARFERDDVIDAALAAVDAPQPNPRDARLGDESLYSKAERISLQEARRLKEEGGKAVQQSDWKGAFNAYDSAIRLSPVDPSLLLLLHNNRSLTAIKLQRYVQAVEDAAYVLQREPSNSKALLRRATALRFLHRPVEALNDVAYVLRMEPHNAEGLLLRRWLSRAEEELSASQRFMEGKAEEASKLCAAVEKLLCQETDNGAAAAAEALQTACRVTERNGIGAAVLFSLRGGVVPVLALTTSLLSRCAETSSAEGRNPVSEETTALCITALRLLSVLFDGAEICTQDTPEGDVRQLVEKEVELLRNWQRGAADPLHRVVNAVLLCLSGMYTAYPALTKEVLSLEWKPITHVWTELSASLSQSSSAQSTVTLFHVCQLLTTCLKAEGGSGPLTLENRLLSQIFEETNDGKTMLIVSVLRSALQSMLPVQTAGLTLAMQCSSLPLPATWNIGVLLSSDAEWCGSLRSITISALSRHAQGKQNENELKFLEAAFALIYNLILSATATTQDRAGVARLWEGGSSSLTLASASWAFIERHSSPGDRRSLAIAPAFSKVLGALCKLASCDPSTLMSSKAKSKMLWAVVVDSVTDLQPFERSSANGNMLAWQIIEHTTTLIAMGIRHAGADWLCATTAELDGLVRLIGIAQPISDTAVQLWLKCLSGNALSVPLVSLGNAALLTSSVVGGSGANAGSFAAQLTQMDGVQTVLESLRSTRTSLLMLARERSKAASAPTALKQLQVWEAHTSSTQKNLAICLSKMCSLSDDLRERLRDLKGMETLASVIGK